MKNNVSYTELTRQTQDIWDAIAMEWDEMMGEGNSFQRVLVGPSVEKLLALQVGERVLELGCGNGVFARRMAVLGAEIIASDFSLKLIELARARSSAYAERIEYRQIDATDEAQIVAVGERSFDAVVCNMAMMDMTTITPLAQALTKVLKPGGRFVFAIMHPCFNGGGTKGIEQEEREDDVVLTPYIKVSKYLQADLVRSPGFRSAPMGHYQFHRPLHELFNTFFAVGFALDGIEEPAFGPEHQRSAAVAWQNMPQIPPVMAARMRLLS